MQASSYPRRAWEGSFQRLKKRSQKADPEQWEDIASPIVPSLQGEEITIQRLFGRALCQPVFV